MGGGGLDYYDTDLLIKLGPDVAGPDAAATEKIAEGQEGRGRGQGRIREAARRPRGRQLGPDGRPRASDRPAEDATGSRTELLALTDPAANGGKVALGVPRRQDGRRHRDPDPRRGREARADRAPRVPRRPPAPRSAAGQSRAERPARAGGLARPSDENPLTPRVMANRVWQHLFGQGLVTTVDNFGVTGDRPSHPELLDHLAARFVRDGWSVKTLRPDGGAEPGVPARLGGDGAPTRGRPGQPPRLAAQPAPAGRRGDPRRDARRRRDLDLARPAGRPPKDLRVVELPNNGPLARRLLAEAAASRHRSLYLPLLRGLTPPSLEVFDFAEQGMVTGSRDTTTVATQALYLLNDPFVRRRALNLAGRLLGRSELDDVARVDLAYRLTLGRAATAAEVDRAQRLPRRLRICLAPADRVDGRVEARRAPRRRPARAGDAESAPSTAGAAAAKKPAPPVNPDEVPPDGSAGPGRGHPGARCEDRRVGQLLPGPAGQRRIPLRPVIGSYVPGLTGRPRKS